MFDIRKASKNDAAALTEISRSTFLETFSKDNSKEDMDSYVSATFGMEKQLAEIQDSNRFVYIAWNENVAAGFFQLVNSVPDSSVSGPKPIEILRLYVDSRWHGKGLGPLLINKCFDVARKNGFQTAWLGVWEKNLRAKAFYSKFGFEVMGSHIFKLGSDEQIDLIMAKSL